MPSPTRGRPTDGLTDHGAFNVFIGVFGVPGTGKSTYALARAEQFGRRQPCIVLAHDPGWRLPSHYPGGRASGIVRHRDTAAALGRIATDPKGVHSIPSTDAAEVIGAAERIAATSLKAHGDQKGVAVLVLIDEAVGAASTSPHRLGEDLRKLMSLRRHLNVGVIFTTQSPRFCHRSMVELATETVCFRMRGSKNLGRLEEGGVPPELLAKIPGLPNYVSVVHKGG